MVSIRASHFVLERGLACIVETGFGRFDSLSKLLAGKWLSWKSSVILLENKVHVLWVQFLEASILVMEFLE